MTETGNERPDGAGLYWLAAAMGTAVSATTSWSFFGRMLNVADWRERAAMFAVVEVMYVACGWATRANVRRGGKPGAARNWAWVLCGLSAYMAVMVSGPALGVGRVLVGPVLALIAMHLALGIEIRAKHGEDAGTWGRIRAELRERFMSRLGLGDDQRTALVRTRDRALDRAARLATVRGWTPGRQARLARAVRVSGATHDEERRALLVEEIATLRYVPDLTRADLPSPWTRHGVASRTDKRPDNGPDTDGDLEPASPLAIADLTQPAIGPVSPTVMAVAIQPDSGTDKPTDSRPDRAPDKQTDNGPAIGTDRRTANRTDSGPTGSPTANPTTDPTEKPAGVSEATLKKIAAARRRRPAATQAEVTKATGVSQRTVERAWNYTYPPVAVDLHKANGAEVLTTLGPNPATS